MTRTEVGLEMVFRGHRDSAGSLWVGSLPGVLAAGVTSGPPGGLHWSLGLGYGDKEGRDKLGVGWAGTERVGQYRDVWHT